MIRSHVAKALLGVAVVASAVTAISRPASAISFDFTPGTTTQKTGTTSITFDDPLPPGVTISDSGAIVQGSLKNQYKAPGTDNGTADGSKYVAVGGNNAEGPVSIALGSLNGYIGGFLGSIDTYNTFKFFNDATLIAEITGTEIANALGLAPNPEGGNYKVDQFVNFFADPGTGTTQFFNRIELSSSFAALEADNFAFRKDIPTPALLPGLVGLGVAAWRKRKGEAAEQA